MLIFWWFILVFLVKSFFIFFILLFDIVERNIVLSENWILVFFLVLFVDFFVVLFVVYCFRDFWCFCKVLFVLDVWLFVKGFVIFLWCYRVISLRIDMRLCDLLVGFIRINDDLLELLIVLLSNWCDVIYCG